MSLVGGRRESSIHCGLVWLEVRLVNVFLTSDSTDLHFVTTETESDRFFQNDKALIFGRQS